MARHHEEQRVAISALTATLAAGLLGLAACLELRAESLVLTVFLTGVGLYGILVTAKHYERVMLHTHRAPGYRDAIAERHPAWHIVEIKERASQRNLQGRDRLDGFIFSRGWGLLYRTRLHLMWFGLHLLVMVLGAVLSAYIILRP